MSWRARLAWSWTLFILVLCWTPRFYFVPDERGPRPFFVPNLDKLVHLTMFAGFSYLWVRVGTSGRRGWWVFLAGVALTVISEVVQESEFVNRDATVGDGLADVAGLLVGLLAFALLRMYQTRGREPTKA